MKNSKKLSAMTSLAVVAATVVPAVASASTVTFTDISSSFAAQAIQDLANQGILNGTGNGMFNPKGNITRQDMAIVLAKALKLNVSAPPSTPTFSDVPTSSYAYAYVEAAAKAGLIHGTGNGAFGYGQNLTREQLAVMLVNALGVDATGAASNLKFTDNSAITYGKDAVGYAVKVGLLHGNPDGSFDPAGNATREQVALVTSSFLKIKNTLAITASSTNVAVGQKVQLSVSGTTDTVQWSVSGNGVIDQTGNFVGTTAGTATVTAVVDGQTLTQAISVYGVATGVKLSTVTDMVANNGASTQSVTATVIDANGNAVANYNGNVTFTLSGTNATLTAAVVPVVNGTATTTIQSGTTTGGEVISASAAGLTGATANFNMNQQVISSVKLVAVPAMIAADGDSKSTIEAIPLDQSGNGVVSDPSGVNVSLSSSNPVVGTLNSISVSDFPLATDPNAPGYYGVVTFNGGASTGSTVISGTATVNGTTVPVTSTTITAGLVGQPAAIKVVGPTAKTPTGDAANFQVEVVDAAGNVVTNAGQLANVQLTPSSNNSQTVTPVTTVQAGNGVAFYSITDAAAETDTLSVSGTYTSGSTVIALPVVTANAQFTSNSTYDFAISSPAQVPAGSYGTVSPINLAATTDFNMNPGVAVNPIVVTADGKSTVPVTVQLTDATGNSTTDGNYSIAIKNNNSSAFTMAAASSVTTVNGKATFNIASNSTSAGMDTYTLTVTMADGSTKNINLNVYNENQGAPAQVALFPTNATTQTVGNDVDFTAVVEDANGFPVTTDNGRTITLSYNNGSTTTTQTATTTNGTATFTQTDKAAEPGTVFASASGLTTSASQDVTFNADASNGVSVSTSVSKVSEGGKLAVSLQLVDANGNAVTGSGTVKVSLNNTAYSLFSTGDNPGEVVAGDGSYVIAQLNSGAATVYLDGGNQVGSTTLTAVAGTGGLGVTTFTPGSLTSGTTQVTTVVAGAASQVVFNTTASEQAGSAQNVVAYLADSQGNSVNVDPTGGIWTLHIAGTNNPIAGMISVDDGTGAHTYTSAGLTVTPKDGVMNLNVTDSAAEKLTYTLTFTPAAGNSFAFSGSTTGSFTNQVGTERLVFSSLSPSTITGDGATVAQYKVELVDAGGNVVTDSTDHVTFSIFAGTDYASLNNADANGNLTVTLNNGVGYATVQSKNVSTAGAVVLQAYTDAVNPNNGTKVAPSTSPVYSQALTVNANTSASAGPVFGSANVANGSVIATGSNISIPVSEVGTTLANGNFTVSESVDGVTKTLVAGVGKDYNYNSGTANLTVTVPTIGTASNAHSVTLAVKATDVSGVANTFSGTYVVDNQAPVASIAASTGSSNSATSLVVNYDSPLYQNNAAIADAADVSGLFTPTNVTITSATYNASTHSVTFVLTGATDGATIAYNNGTAATKFTDAVGNAYAGNTYTYAATGTLWSSGN